MAKKKQRLNKGQQRRIKANHRRKLQPEPLPDDASLGPVQEGLTISRYGQHADIELADGRVVRSDIRRTVDSLVCGDRVQVRENLAATSGSMAVIEAVHPRHSLLTRPDYYDGVKPVAANIDQIIIVTAVEPPFSSQLLDRYLIAAEQVDIEPVIVLNKTDRLADQDEAVQQHVSDVLATYTQLGYRVLQLSAKEDDSCAQLDILLTGKVSIFVGQSGVGKSSLINRLLPHADQSTGAISSNSGLGQHTTTSARLIHIDDDADLIDSPGVREFALWHMEPQEITWGYREFRDYLGGCKYRDCKHGDDPGCLIRAAVEQGDIARFRYDNYLRILQTMRDDRPTSA